MAEPVRRGLPPVIGERPRLLILGSFPGVESLRQARYYAHPRNAFWPLMGELLGAGPELPYDRRLDRLREAGIALWDVLTACARAGSGDDAIEPAKAVRSDLASLVAAHPTIRLIACNGQTSYGLARRNPGLAAQASPPMILGLPSTSPRNARAPELRRRRWHEALAPWLALPPANGLR